ncbi:MAG: MoxR family ATPase [Candidatus Omnitrophica bacterium]|nr:MoxR family ATPase [Candidatus Omnitrophota bacterium]
MPVGVAAPSEQSKEVTAQLQRLAHEINKVIIGQRTLIERLLVGLLANGHVLLEGVPGLAKTLSVKTLAQTLSVKFQRIQFTPDLLPADLIGTLIFNPRDGGFTVKKGPVFANIILADEINRAPAKVQSALLEAMQERQVTIGEQTFRLEEPFMVLATQNPIEQEGTYPLPEAQVDRFMLKTVISYPNRPEEKRIMEQMASANPSIAVDAVMSVEQLLQARAAVSAVYLDDKIKEYVLDIVMATRNPKTYAPDLVQMIHYGASPRATIYLALAAKACAFLQGRNYVVPQDIKSIGLDVLRHRVIPTYEAEAEGMTSESILKQLFERVPVP